MSDPDLTQEKQRIKPFVIPIILWAYVFSVVLAPNSWGAVYDCCMTAFDLSPNQGWILPIASNVLVALMGIPQVITLVRSRRRREKIAGAPEFAYWLSMTAVALSISVSVRLAVYQRNHLSKGAIELVGGEQERVFAAGKIVNGIYSNGFVGVTMELPKDWHTGSLNSIRRAKRSGAYAVVGQNTQGVEERVEEFVKERRGDFALLEASRYPEDFTGHNPSLYLAAYDKRPFAASGIQSLEAYATGYAAGMPEPYHVLTGPSPVHFGNETGFHVYSEGRFPTATVQKHIYFIETDLYYVLAVGSSVDEAEWGTMRRAINTLRVKKNVAAGFPISNLH